MKFCELQPSEFESFVNENFSHYTQSRIHFDYKHEHDEPVYLVGVKEGDEVLAACLLNSAPAFKFFNYFYSHRGPVMDYNNKALVDLFYTELKQYLKARNGLFALVDPHIVMNYRDSDGNITEEKDVKGFIEQLQGLGYKHRGFPVGYSNDSQARFLSVLNIEDKSEDELLREMEYKTRRNINKTYEMGVRLRDLSIDETDKFFELFKMAEDKHGFSFRDFDYFVKMQQIYKDQCRLVLSYIDLDEHLDILRNTLNQKEEEYNKEKLKLDENPDFRKLRNKVEQLEKAVDKDKKKIKEIEALRQSDGKILHLASALYIHNEHELYYLSSGSNPKYNQFMGPYNMMFEMIKYAKNLNLKTYNFYGVTGVFTEDAEDYGVLKFKKGFNAHVEEYIGDFILPLSQFYKLYELKQKL
ncbi:aminoacyltransferase [Macrococcus armenti]|uniref:aminoacyltransferase n=1 Tax=Macrococcus armenti TaxID=2875764 RepID=UPI001CCB4B6B|nr:aminoacyltransferase [Macrococcus armenti]UBH08724.1 aminoacyltransferase [Macrococcus armenti]UBH11022.1 aminoacyltransferase [Macrococcus armenti]UBH15501.1 aminoacyltransferase [Macrococcus armenti]UBH17861.1 aminoacyltransferase [Macrococcus armenti]UBH20126.1 aminoacyltransferase [Macrococcus armenti]